MSQSRCLAQGQIVFFPLVPGIVETLRGVQTFSAQRYQPKAKRQRLQEAGDLGYDFYLDAGIEGPTGEVSFHSCAQYDYKREIFNSRWVVVCHVEIVNATSSPISYSWGPYSGVLQPGYAQCWDAGEGDMEDVGVDELTDGATVTFADGEQVSGIANILKTGSDNDVDVDP